MMVNLFRALYGPVHRKHNARTLSEVLKRGMENEWLGPYRDECIIGEHPEFIQFHNQAVKNGLKKYAIASALQ